MFKWAKLKDLIFYLMPLIVFLLLWHVFTFENPDRQFIYSTPSKVAMALWQGLVHGDLLMHTAVTAFETVAGFVIGTAIGTCIGLGLWYSTCVAKYSRPYIVAIGAVPVFAFAPVIIVWFGIGIFAKIMMAALSTVVVSIVQSYQGAMSADLKYLRMMQVMGANRFQVFTKVVTPSAFVWVINSMKLNVGLALLGAFIGEFISSEYGLGYVIVKSSGLYDMANVFASCFLLTLIAITLNYYVGKIERKFLGWDFKGEMNNA